MRKLTMDELGRLTTEQFKEAEKMPVVIVLDNIRSLSNIGSVFRTADAFCIECIMLCGITAKPPHREIHKTALGATESVEWKYYPSTAEAIVDLKKQGYQVVGVEQTDGSELLHQAKFHHPLALVFGNEVNGIDENVIKMCDFCTEIPQSGTKHSLNVAVCAGVVIWHIYSQYQYNT
jgi:23S rRNA (guanosine2251-2'-O)-methyltransferase